MCACFLRERSGWIQRGSAADKYGQRECTAVIVESWPEKTTWRSVGPPARFRPGCPRVDLVLVLPGFVKCWAGRVKQDGGCDSVEREAGLLVQGTDSASRRRLEQAEACVLGRQVCGVQVLHLVARSGLGRECAELGRARDRIREVPGCRGRQVPLHQEHRAGAVRVAEALCGHARTLRACGAAPRRGNYVTLVRPDHTDCRAASSVRDRIPSLR